MAPLCEDRIELKAVYPIRPVSPTLIDRALLSPVVNGSTTTCGLQLKGVETLLDAKRFAEITQLDEEDLWRSYSLAYSQRLSGIFNWCHRVFWRYLEVTHQFERQTGLFMVSSFVWRLNGNREMERTYLELLKNRTSEDFTESSGLTKLLRYCRSRLAALAACQKLVAK